MSIVQDESGNPEYVISIVEDITERKLVEQRQTIEHAVTRLLADSGSIAETMPRVIQIIGDSLGRRGQFGCIGRVVIERGQCFVDGRPRQLELCE